MPKTPLARLVRRFGQCCVNHPSPSLLDGVVVHDSLILKAPISGFLKFRVPDIPLAYFTNPLLFIKAQPEKGL